MWEMKETGVRSQGEEDPLEEEMATHSSFLAWISPWTEKPSRLQSMGWSLKESNTTEHVHKSQEQAKCQRLGLVCPWISSPSSQNNPTATVAIIVPFLQMSQTRFRGVK